MTELRYAKSGAAESQVERPRCAQLRIMWNFALDRILHHARCFSLRGESYRLKHPEPYATD